jgi:hypothetical protein
VVVNLVDHGVDNALSGTGSLVILDSGLAGLLSRADDLEGWEAFDAELTTERLVLIFVTVDSGDFGETIEVLGGLLVGRLEVLAMAAPRRVELEDL